MPDLHKVLGNLDAKLSYAEGHSIAIYNDLDLEYTTSGGHARVNPDVTMTSTIRMDVLSMSKTITAAGIVRQLLAMGLTPAEKIGPHLPSDWTVDPKVASLTFAHVLTHSGGLKGDAAEAPALQALCAAPPAGTIGKVDYQNINYSLLRLLLAYLEAGPILNRLLALPLPQVALSVNSVIFYELNILKHILNPSGVTEATIGQVSPVQAEWFTDNKGDLGDQHNPPDAGLLVGSDFWNMNVREYGRFIAHLVEGQLHPNPWPMMRDTRAPGISAPPPAYPSGDARLGVWRFQAPDGSGNYYGHNGEWTGAAFTGWMGFETGASVVFFANSARGPEEQEKMILDSWLAA
jgi:CubicO group peptidase (beta-lactamase class C family)